MDCKVFFVSDKQIYINNSAGYKKTANKFRSEFTEFQSEHLALDIWCKKDIRRHKMDINYLIIIAFRNETHERHTFLWTHSMYLDEIIQLQLVWSTRTNRNWIAQQVDQNALQSISVFGIFTDNMNCEL